MTEWKFPRGGCLQIYQLSESAGHGSFTLAVTGIESETRRLESMGLDTSQRSSSSRVNTVTVTDPDGNHIAFAEALDPALARCLNGTGGISDPSVGPPPYREPE